MMVTAMLVPVSFFKDLERATVYLCCCTHSVVPVLSFLFALVTILQFGVLLPDGQYCCAGPPG